MPSLVRTICIGLVALCLLSTPGLTADATYSYDALGRLSRVEDATGKSVVYHYDAAGNRTSVVYNGTNGAPTANADSKTTTAIHPITFDPRTNDSDPDNDALTITQKTNPSHGAVVINSGQTLTYTPNTNWSGSDSFTYTIDDGHQHTATATVSMTVINHQPVAIADYVGTNFNTAVTFDPRSNDYDPDGEPLKITSPGSTQISTPHGSVTGTNTSVTYTPTSGYSGTDTFNYTISDYDTGTATAAVTVTVTPQNTAPVAVDDWGRIWERHYAGETYQPLLSGLAVLANDTDSDGDALTVTAVTQPTSGQAHSWINADNTVGYSWNTAVDTLQTTDTFTYTISDGHNHTATATVTVTINVDRWD